MTGEDGFTPRERRAMAVARSHHLRRRAETLVRSVSSSGSPEGMLLCEVAEGLQRPEAEVVDMVARDQLLSSSDDKGVLSFPIWQFALGGTGTSILFEIREIRLRKVIETMIKDRGAEATKAFFTDPEHGQIRRRDLIHGNMATDPSDEGLEP